MSDAQNNGVRYSFRLLRAGRFRLDGGSMFGLIPRVVWSRTVEPPPDDKGRIEVQHNCLLLERQGGPDTDAKGRPIARRVLLEVGTGNKLDEKSRAIFALEDRSIIDALGEVGVAPESIDTVVVSHLHFDHAGGLTRLCRDGETPDWTGPASCFSGSRGEHGVKRTFPNAKVVVQSREWDDAVNARSVMSRTYFEDHLEPVKAQLALVDSPRAFAPGYTPGRDQEPSSPVERRTTMLPPALGPGIGVFLVPGHTWGQQATAFVGGVETGGKTVVFVPDVMPTRWHVGQSYSLAYDVEPYTSMVSRRWLLAEAARYGWVLCLDHEPGVNPFFTVRYNGKGWYELEQAEV